MLEYGGSRFIWPLPSAKHVVVVHDLASRFPAAKLVSSTMAGKVIPVLEDIYNTYGNPELQTSDDGPPFNSKKMVHFADKRDIKLRTTPPHHPKCNPCRNLHENDRQSIEGLPPRWFFRQGGSSGNPQQLTSHPATGIPPANMMFRDSMKSQFPRRSSSQAEIMAAKERDLHQKERKQMDVNSSKYRKTSNFVVGDLVLDRNYTKKSKFNPEFMTVPFEVIKINTEAKKLTLRKINGDNVLIRHPDDVKLYYGEEYFRMKMVNDPEAVESLVEMEVVLHNRRDDEESEDCATADDETGLNIP